MYSTNRILVTALLLPTFALACGGSQKPQEPRVEVRYLPAPTTRCLMRPPPTEPQPPACLLSKTQGCSTHEEDEYLARLLDDQVRVRRWAEAWWSICGEVKP